MGPVADLITNAIGVEKHCFNPMDDTNQIPEKHGLYAICIKNKSKLPVAVREVHFPEIDEYLLLYLGTAKTQNLRKRGYENHFNGSARKSTVRKSLGSLWKMGRHVYDDGSYRFVEACEDEITDWMLENAIIFYWAVNNDDSIKLAKAEEKLINEIDPPLNIEYNKSPINETFRKFLSASRKRSTNIP